MSIRPVIEPVCSHVPSATGIADVIDARPRSLRGVAVRRVLPAAARRTVGPFTFFDHMGAAVFGPGEGIDVPPHPHIGLATVTYLFEGELVHRDSLGSEQPIRPGDINWMTAGRGIVHSERTPATHRQDGSRLHGLQLWVALPLEHEETMPAFRHYPGASLPEREQDGVRIRVLAGTAYDLTSPVATLSPLFYVDAELPAGGQLTLPGEHEERAAYVVEGAVRCGGERTEPGRMLIVDAGPTVTVRAESPARIVLIGGAPVGRRHIYWNFVSSSRERIEAAKQAWKEGRFAKVPGDEVEFVPLPE